MKRSFLLSCLGIWLCVSQSKVHAQALWEQAQTFIQSLNPQLREQLIFEYNDPERTKFHFVPKPRKGPTFHEFDTRQTALALQLLRSSLSAEGYLKAQGIRELEEVLIILDQYNLPDGSLARDPLNYHFSIFGNPGPDALWGWRFEGHHLSFNFSSSNGKILAATPTFMGSNPGIVPIEKDRGNQVLREESQRGLELINTLTEEQLLRAKFSDTAPRDILTGAKQTVEPLTPLGIAFSELNAEQQEAFMELLEVYIGNYIFEFSDTFRQKIKDAGVEHLYFAWAGAMQWGEPHYYRIQGPMLIIEYDNTQNNANHVHTVVRDLTNDFAAELLQEHYRSAHQN